MIEYYEGVLFLTTNRKADLDNAFLSRIHITIKFPQLSSEVRAAIWKNLVQKNACIIDGKRWPAEIFAVLGELELNVRKKSSSTGA